MSSQTFVALFVTFFVSIWGLPTVTLINTGNAGEGMQYDSVRDRYLLSETNSAKMVLLTPDLQVIADDFADIRGNPQASTIVGDVFYVVLRDRVDGLFTGVGKYSLITGEELAYYDLDPNDEPNDPCYDPENNLLFVTQTGVGRGDVALNNENIWIFDEDLNLVKEFGTQALVDAGNITPNGCIVDDETVYFVQRAAGGLPNSATAVVEYDIEDEEFTITNSFTNCIVGDGLTIDRCGNLWMTCGGSVRTVQYREEGTLDWIPLFNAQYQDIGYDSKRNRLLPGIFFGPSARTDVLQITDPDCPDDSDSSDSDSDSSESDSSDESARAANSSHNNNNTSKELKMGLIITGSIIFMLILIGGLALLYFRKYYQAKKSNGAVNEMVATQINKIKSHSEDVPETQEA